MRLRVIKLAVTRTCEEYHYERCVQVAVIDNELTRSDVPLVPAVRGALKQLRTAAGCASSCKQA
jgi:hypothetical protein